MGPEKLLHADTCLTHLKLYVFSSYETEKKLTFKQRHLLNTAKITRMFLLLDLKNGYFNTGTCSLQLKLHVFSPYGT